MDLTKFRVYDPALGRWWQVDPMADAMSSWTPYNYGFNSPIRFNDPLGDRPESNSISSGAGGADVADEDEDWIYDQQKDGSWKKREGVQNDGGKDHHTYQYQNGDSFSFNQKTGVGSFIKKGETEKKAKEAKAKIDRALTKVENFASELGKVADVVAFTGYVAAAPTEGTSLPIAVGASWVSAGASVVKYGARAMRDGINAELKRDVILDIVFGVAPEPVERMINKTGLDKTTKDILGAQVNKLNSGVQFAVDQSKED